MKRKLDPNKIYAFIGRVVVYSSLYIGAVVFGMWAFCQNTIYQDEGNEKFYFYNNYMVINYASFMNR